VRQQTHAPVLILDDPDNVTTERSVGYLYDLLDQQMALTGGPQGPVLLVLNLMPKEFGEQLAQTGTWAKPPHSEACSAAGRCFWTPARCRCGRNQGSGASTEPGPDEPNLLRSPGLVISSATKRHHLRALVGRQVKITWDAVYVCALPEEIYAPKLTSSAVRHSANVT
jgi:hypothetical protein